MRGQASLEFLAFVGISLAILVVFSLVSYGRNLELQRESAWVAGWSACKQVAFEIDAAYNVGDGYEHSFALPAKLDNRLDYSVEFVPAERSVWMNWSGDECYLPVLASQVEGAINKGYNRVENDGGVVRFG